MWIFYSFLGAIFQATEMAIKKKALQTRGVNNLIAFLAFTLAGILLAILFYLKTGSIWPQTELTSRFWQGMFWGVSLNIIAVYFLYKALDIADLSYLMPFMTLTSLSLIIPPIIIFHEIPSFSGFIGILLIVAGAIGMEFKKRSDGISETDEQKNKRKNNRKGVLFFLVTAICFTITPTALAVSVRESSALFTTYLSHLLIGIGFIFLIVAFREKNRMKEVLRKKTVARSFLFAIILASISIAIANGSINVALGMADVSYVFAIKRIMPLFAFVIGYAYFKERTDVRKKIMATALMILGAILITVFK